ncbi:Zinc finger protein [Armadillidium nasatum]|uniref:Zinc finger protein n=1 Tax=Armadillidium nasatum TaxID=96803 RepID=A0A5N5T807_9CRUS|nr:Zinc finger protein [Armadillidium nasatum]
MLNITVDVPEINVMINTKIFKCSSCDYECKRKSKLLDHMLVHSDTKLLKCTECTYESNYKSNLKVHTHVKTP